MRGYHQWGVFSPRKGCHPVVLTIGTGRNARRFWLRSHHKTPEAANNCVLGLGEVVSRIPR